MVSLYVRVSCDFSLRRRSPGLSRRDAGITSVVDVGGGFYKGEVEVFYTSLRRYLSRKG